MLTQSGCLWYPVLLACSSFRRWTSERPGCGMGQVSPTCHPKLGPVLPCTPHDFVGNCSHCETYYCTSRGRGACIPVEVITATGSICTANNSRRDYNLRGRSGKVEKGAALQHKRRTSTGTRCGCSTSLDPTGKGDGGLDQKSSPPQHN